MRTMQTHGLFVLQGNLYEVDEARRHTLPASVQGIVQTRLDRLPAAEKSLLQLAAVIGPAVSVPVLQALVHGTPEELHRRLRALQAAELLYETGTMPSPTYTFKHALVQDAAYQSLLPRTRQQYHQQELAQVLEQQFPDTAATQPELLAQHYTAAGLPTHAIPYWQEAGQQARQRSANQEAVQHLTTGLALLATLPRPSAGLQAGTRPAAGPRVGVNRHQGLCRSRSGADLCAGAGTVRPGRRHAPALPDAAGPLSVLLRPGGFSGSAGAGGTALSVGAVWGRTHAPPGGP